MNPVNTDDIDAKSDADLLKAQDDFIRRSLDDSAAGESIKTLALTGAAVFVIAGIVGFIVAAIAVKVLR